MKPKLQSLCSKTVKSRKKKFLQRTWMKSSSLIRIGVIAYYDSSLFGLHGLWAFVFGFMVNVKCERTAFNVADARTREHCKWLVRINRRLGKIHWMRAAFLNKAACCRWLHALFSGATQDVGQFPLVLNRSGFVRVEARGWEGGKRWGLGPTNDVLTTCKAVTARGGQRIIAGIFPTVNIFRLFTSKKRTRIGNQKCLKNWKK